MGDKPLKMFRENRDKRNERTAAWHRGNPERSYCLAAKRRAKAQNVPFNLTPEDIVFPDLCPVLGIPLLFNAGGRTNNTPSIDRIVPNKGYTKDNIRVISWRANRLKTDASLEELKKLVEYMEKNQ